MSSKGMTRSSSLNDGETVDGGDDGYPPVVPVGEDGSDVAGSV